jgi:uncharacterized protein YutE (UPF0331/DUF86 family)
VTGGRVSKGQRRIGAILQEIPAAREQLLVTMEEFGPSFAQERFIAAARSSDVHERNRVTIVERLFEVLLNWAVELAARALVEGQRLGIVDKSSGPPWERLAALGAISYETAARLQKAKELRDILAHAYPPANWKTLHEGVRVFVEELDPYVASFERWVSEEEILPPAGAQRKGRP